MVITHKVNYFLIKDIIRESLEVYAWNRCACKRFVFHDNQRPVSIIREPLEVYSGTDALANVLFTMTTRGDRIEAAPAKI